MDTRHKIVVHVGGAYSDKAAALDRWSSAVCALPDAVRARLVLENDERLFGAEDVLSLPLQPEYRSCSMSCTIACTPVQAPTKRCRSSCACRAHLARRNATASRRSTTPARQPGCDVVRTPSTSTRPSSRISLPWRPTDVEFDCMLEAKAKDLALFRVRDALGIAA